MKLIAELSHVLLYEDSVNLTSRCKRDYKTATEYRKPQTYTIVSKDRKQLWSLMLVKFLGPQDRFLLNGRGEGFKSPLDAAMFVNQLMRKELPLVA